MINLGRITAYFLILYSACIGAVTQAAGQPIGQTSDPLNTNPGQAYVNVRAFGCIGDDVHDDSGCFVAARNYLQNHSRQNLTPASDRNRLGGAMLYVPPGTYLITEPEAMMSHNYKTRTNGYHLSGSGTGITLIDYRPRVHGPLFFNNDAWLGISINNISFTSNDAEADFLDSYAAGGAQGCRFTEISWTGLWGNLFRLTGTNNNSEFDWDKVTIAAKVRSTLYIPATDTSDQFLNYWFRNSKLWLASGNFIEAHKGGHFKIDDCDFSGLKGSGKADAPSILFGLYGNAHARGVTHLECRNSRFELISNSVRVLYSEWGSMGEISFEDDDFSSQIGNYEPVEEFGIEMVGAGGAAQYTFARSQLAGFVRIGFNPNDGGYRRNVTFEDVQFNSYDDYSQGVRFDPHPTSAPNHGMPIVECVRCRGADRNTARIQPWREGTLYHFGDQVYSHGRIYRAETNGASGHTPPSGRGASLTDGNITWSVLEIYSGSEYVGNGILRPSGFIPSGSSPAEHSVVVTSSDAGNSLPSHNTALTSGPPRIVLPPFAFVTRMQVVVLPGSCTQASQGSYAVRTDSIEPRSLFSAIFSPLNGGGTRDYIPPTPYSAGQELGSRTFVIEAGQGTEQSCAGWLMIWYL